MVLNMQVADGQGSSNPLFTFRNLCCGGLLILMMLGLASAYLLRKRIRHWMHERYPLPVSTERIVDDGTYRNVVFLHHSTGRALIEQGGVRELLRQRNYQFWDHEYNTYGLTRPDGTRTGTQYEIPETKPGVRGGGNTDPEGLAVLFAQPVHSPADNAFSRLLQHQVIIFKSCFPNSGIKNDAMLARHKSLYLGMRQVMDQHSNRIFILVTTPPLHPLATNPEEARRARELALWLQSSEFLEGHSNLFVFDFHSLLADPKTGMLRAEYQLKPDSSDSHPNALANRNIGPLFVDFVDKAIQSYAHRSIR